MHDLANGLFHSRSGSFEEGEGDNSPRHFLVINLDLPARSPSRRVGIIEPSDNIVDALGYERVSLDITEPDALFRILDEHLVKKINQIFVDLFVHQLIVVTIWRPVDPCIKGFLTRLRRRVNRPQALSGDIDLLGSDLPEHGPFVLCNEGNASEDHAEKRNSQRPYINLLSDPRLYEGSSILRCFSVAELGCEESRGPNSLSKLEVIVKILGFGLRDSLVTITDWPSEVRYAEVRNLNTVVLCLKQIGGLDITVNDTLVVEVL